MTVILKTGSDIVLLSASKHNTRPIYGEMSRMTTVESQHTKAEYFGVIEFKNGFIRIDKEGQGMCVVPYNKIIGYHASFK
jgi:hypothetical protein